MLSIVSTPIGHLEDMTYRGVRTLREADIIACEDTRTTGKLLKAYDISTPMTSFHSHTGEAKIERIVAELAAGKHVALVSDAGTPGISDPGFALIRRAVEADIRIEPIPGASAVLAGLVGSGFDTHHFLYLGFLPIKKGRQTLFTHAATLPYTIVFYESVHRIQKTLEELEKYFGPDRRIAIGRELTKMHEEFVRGTASEVRAYFEKTTPRGEFVVMIERSE
jgi:16S rRNA (cytidine1402-2'-O)-methyltransferase